MERRYSKLKEEFMDLVGTISVEEIIANRPLSKVIKEISDSLTDFSIVNRYNLKEL
jgi:hypothetical protein